MAKQKKKKNSKLPVIFFIFVFIVGLSLLLYPSISTLWNSVYQSHAMIEYTELVSQFTPERIQQMLEEAQSINDLIYAQACGQEVSQEEIQETYHKVLNIDGKGMMGILSIPKINVRLSISHGTDAGVLQDAVGHLENTSLPIGGVNTHCALSGHTGLPSARLLTDLDQLEVGDYFVLEILGELLYYQVDQVRVVLPHQVSLLSIVPGMDLCTLITCTPYGVNSHRLLVRGVRVLTDEPISDEVLAAGNPDYVPANTAEPDYSDRDTLSPDDWIDQSTGDLTGLTFDRNMPWWLRNVYTPIYIAVGAVFLLLAGLLLPRLFRKKKKQPDAEEQMEQTEQQEQSNQKEEPEEKQ